jgi:hypothetical protein
VAFHVDHAAVDINGDDFEFALLQQNFENSFFSLISRDFTHINVMPNMIAKRNKKCAYCFQR